MLSGKQQERLAQLKEARELEISVGPRVRYLAEIEAVSSTNIAHAETLRLIRAAISQGIPLTAIREAVGAKNHLTWKKLKEEAQA